ncbi:MAG TPA: copper chaperone PCu(A)C [Moraxellaceae bacterium]
MRAAIKAVPPFALLPVAMVALCLSAPVLAQEKAAAPDTAKPAAKATTQAPVKAPVKATPPVITDAWISEAPPVAKNNAAFITLKNGSRRDALLAVETPAAESAELHQMNMAGGILRMQRLPLINLAPNVELKLAAGARHIMLINMKQPLKAGDKVPLTLIFRQAGRITVDAVVRPVQLQEQEKGAAPAAEHQH